jgi:soluble lytic murein transglycosylase-like protein
LKTLAIYFLIFFGSAAHADAGQNYLADIIDACAVWKVPPKLVIAIIQHESGFSPWAVNVAGQSYKFNSKEKALELAGAAQAAGKSYDLGLMQVNSAWLKKFNLAPETVLDPRNNIYLGTWILAKEIQRFGLTWRAVASYHTPVAKNPERARRYAEAIISKLRRMQ